MEGGVSEEPAGKMVHENVVALLRSGDPNAQNKFISFEIETL